MKTYLAAKYSRRKEMEEISKLIKPYGLDVIARWVFGDEEGMSSTAICDMDLDDVEDSDCVIVFTHPRSEPQPGGGRFVEMGYAMAFNKYVVVIGPVENVFCEDKMVERYETLEEFLEGYSDNVRRAN